MKKSGLLPVYLSVLLIGATSCGGGGGSGGGAAEIFQGPTANTHPNVYDGYFLYGSNMGWLNDNWRDEDVADILIGNPGRGWVGVGVNSLRPALPEYFVEQWGYENKVNTFKYYFDQNAKLNVVFIGDSPSEQHREKRQYATGVQSQSYENLYEPIWIEGQGGRTVNRNNHYAWYVYNLVTRYKNYVKFWEIKNEPDLTGSNSGWDGNWLTRDPYPAELVNFGAPIQSYIRMLRISYEVIKSVDPQAYVCVGGIGYESFLDAILRNTDNPDSGKVTERYPYKGGAWFDCLSFHIYPMYSLRSWENNRHSDAAVAAVENQTKTYVDLLKNYGYGNVYPAKEMIITETNIPGKEIGDFIGSDQAQRNYLMKAAVIGQKNQIRGIYPFCVWDARERDQAGWEYDFMGFYKPLPNSPGSGTLRVNESGTGWRTTSRLLGNRKYDEDETLRLNLPAQVDGGAFYSSSANDYVYALWAKTTTDRSESASASYSFPASMGVTGMDAFNWEETQTSISGNTVSLTATPLFIKTR